MKELVSLLGVDRIHQYGSCGDGHEIAPKPIANAAEVIGTYKFYFSFENTIVDGYVSEKLMVPLSIGALPVYYGAPDILNITLGKSFIKVLDFSSPKDLANYLLYLSNNETAYMNYHTWRQAGPEAFNPKYLEIMSNNNPPKKFVDELMSGREKYEFKKNKKGYKPERRLSCCKLCSLAWVKLAASSGGSRKIVSKHWSSDFINQTVFSRDQ